MPSALDVQQRGIWDSLRVSSQQTGEIFRIEEKGYIIKKKEGNVKVAFNI